MAAPSGYNGFAGYIGPQGRGGYGDAGQGYGGLCVLMLASAALNVGQSVYISAAGHVNAGATANLAGTLGVVVGGQASKGRCYPEAPVGSAAASAAEQWVAVCISGMCRAIADAAVAAGVSVGFGATAGRLDDLVTDATTIVGQRIGKSLTAAAGAASEFDVWVGVH